MNKKKKKMIFCGSILLVIATAIIIGAAYSFFIKSDDARNSLTMGNQDIDLTEPNWDPSRSNLVTPGKTLIKDPTLIGREGKNYARLVVEFYDLDTGEKITKVNRIEKIKELMYYDKDYNKTGTPATINLNPNSTYSNAELNSLINSQKIEKLCNSNDFVLDDSRSTDTKLVFKYKRVLNESEEKVLFSNLVIPTDYTSSDLDLLGNFKIRVYAEAIQSENIGSMDEAFRALDGDNNG